MESHSCAYATSRRPICSHGSLRRLLEHAPCRSQRKPVGQARSWPRNESPFALKLLASRASRIGELRAQAGERAAGRAAPTTARALSEIAGPWDAVYEAMRRKDDSQEARER